MIATVGPTLATQFSAVSIDYAAVAPLLIVFTGALIGVLIEAFSPRGIRQPIQLGLALVTLVAAFVTLVTLSVNHHAKTLGGSVVVDGPAVFLQGVLLIMAVLGVLTFAERWGGREADAFTPMGASTPGSSQEAAATRAGFVTSEVFPLALLATGGMLLFVAANDLITLFIALEVLSLPLYVLTGLARRRRLLSQEASLKYFLLGAFASAFLLFGSALLYGYAGSVDFDALAATISSGTSPYGPFLLPGILLVLVGLLFKIGAAPFQMWTPDVYQGAPTPVTGFMAAATKAAAFGAILRFAYVAVEGARWDWRAPVIGVAALTMIVGAVLSVTQTDIKRLLAYSSIAHAGFILVGLLGFSQAGISGVMFYLTAYGLSTLAAFAIVSMVRENGAEATHLSQWAGLGRSHPVVAATFALLLLAFAGIPLTSGFTAKYAAFAPAVASGGRAGIMLVVLAVLCSAVTAFVYVRIIVLMYFTQPSGDNVDVLMPSWATTVTVTVGALATVILGILPGPVLDLAQQAAQFIR
ncbi:MAG: NADH-quinone oxidoreductase subunit NuoN [Nostocoides sp.]